MAAMGIRGVGTVIVTVMDQSGGRVPLVNVGAADAVGLAGTLQPDSRPDPRDASAVPRHLYAPMTVVADFHDVHSFTASRGQLA